MKAQLYKYTLFVVTIAFLVGCSNSTDKVDISESIFITESITIYSDGYYGLSSDEPMIIEDEDKIIRIIEIASKTDEYSVVQEGELLEGLNGLWIDFNNGTIIGMYEDEDYGSISDRIRLTGSPNYHLPKDLRRYIIEILEAEK